MIKQLLLFATALLTLPAFCQEKEKQEIMKEAKLLYNSERASWSGTDIFMAKFPEKREKMGGYFSYSQGNQHKCVFVDNQASPNVLATILFDDGFVIEASKTDTVSRKLTPLESDLYTIRQKALAEVRTDTLFKHYKNTSLNLIPIIHNNKKKVYMLTGPSATGVVIFGNDYLVEFDKNNAIKSKKVLHKNIIPINYTDNEGEISTIHNHTKETGYLPTATDICTLLLYAQYTHWQQHYVISKKYISIWDCNKEEFFVMTTEAWEKISKDSEDRKSKGGKN
ncbi:hypothetical protein [Flavobacterium subsaxonicum]|uniref:hypothetical protein n=1 Tax=Flavobacterium subsaxonicum TaxID=426226 RepID=UPI00040A4E08|nr:hypothetical protein [Flavobacterium subsaxonicum]